MFTLFYFTILNWFCHTMTRVFSWQNSISLTMNSQGWFPLGLTGLISLLSKELSKVFSSTTAWKHILFSAQPSLWPKSHICTWLLEKTIAWLHGLLSAKWCLCFVVRCQSLSYLFLQEANMFWCCGCSHCLQWFLAQENNICHCFCFFSVYLFWSDGIRCHNL